MWLLSKSTQMCGIKHNRNEKNLAGYFEVKHTQIQITCTLKHDKHVGDIWYNNAY